MKVIFPMAGTGNRFVQAGYTDPKPLIHVNGKRIIEYICEMFDKENDEFIFICNDIHLRDTNMREVLTSISPSSKILEIPQHKKGPVYTLIDFIDYINDNEEVIICYCDNPYLWDYNHFKSWIHEKDSDGCILSHVGFHPHRLSSTYMAYMKESNLEVSEIKEKEPYTEDPMTEHASTGTYYFKKGSYIKKYFQQLMDLDINYNGEYYVTLVYNLLIKDNLLVHCYPTEFTTVFGTPEEVQNFEAWQTILQAKQVKNVEDAIKTYNYWKSYNEKSNTLQK
jgi:NDP-sugar pyrophosphorylase family protein